MPVLRTTAYLAAAEHLGTQVRERRKKNAWTQEDLAEKTGISRNQIQNIENNRNNSRDVHGRPGPANPALDTVYALAHALQCTVSELIEPPR